MIFYALEGKIHDYLKRKASSPLYPLAVGGLAFVSTLTMSFPFGSILVPAVLIGRSKWKKIWIFSALGAGIGASLVVLFFHYVGWTSLEDRFPYLTHSQEWLRIENWVWKYGAVALFFVAVSPLPLTPALLACGILRMPYGEALVALNLGKSIKYFVYSWIAFKFPATFERIRSHIQ